MGASTLRGESVIKNLSPDRLELTDEFEATLHIGICFLEFVTTKTNIPTDIRLTTL